MTDPELASSVLTLIFGYSDHTVRMYPQSDGFIEMCRQIAQFVLGSGKIDVFRIWGHGCDGNQSISAGKDLSDSYQNDAGLYNLKFGEVYYGNVKDLSPVIRQLGDFFTADGHLELKGCNVAAGPGGQQLIRDIADSLGRKVQASMVMQTANAVSYNGYGWTGPVMEVGGADRYFEGSHL